MKKYSSNVYWVLTVIVLSCFANVSFSQNSKKIIGLTRLKGANNIANVNLNKSNNPPIQVRLAVDSIQQVSDKGIKFSITWVNNSSKNIVANNLLNGVHVNVVNFKNGYSSKNRAGGIVDRAHWVLEDQSFEIEAVNINNSRMNSEIVKKQTISLPPNSTLEIKLYIKEAIKFDKQNPISASDYRAIPFAIPKGEYDFSITVGVNSADKETMKFDELLTIPKVVIKYGL